MAPNNTTRFDNVKEHLNNSARKIGAEIHIYHVAVDYGLPYLQALQNGAPRTPEYSKSRTIDTHYLSHSAEEKTCHLVLLHFPKRSATSYYHRAIAWAKENNVDTTVPREVFALGEQFPQLRSALVDGKMGYMCITVAETTGCRIDDALYLCAVQWEYSAPKAGLTLAECFYHEIDYFAFKLVL